MKIIVCSLSWARLWYWGMSLVCESKKLVMTCVCTASVLEVLLALISIWMQSNPDRNLWLSPFPSAGVAVWPFLCSSSLPEPFPLLFPCWTKSNSKVPIKEGSFGTLIFVLLLIQKYFSWYKWRRFTEILNFKSLI